jgi:hypothetical protein
LLFLYFGGLILSFLPGVCRPFLKLTSRGLLNYVTTRNKIIINTNKIAVFINYNKLENRVAFQEQGAVHLLTGLLQNRDKLVQKWSEMALVKLIHELDSASARSK